MTAVQCDDDRLARLGRVGVAMALATTVGFVVFRILSWDLPRPDHFQLTSPLSFGLNVLDHLATLVVSAVLLSRVPRNAISWIPLGVVLGSTLYGGAEALARWSLATDVLPLLVTRLVAWTTQWTFLLTILAVAPLLLLYPTGRPPGRRWRWLLVAIVAHGVTLAVVLMLYPGPIADFTTLTNPFGVGDAPAMPADQLPVLIEVLFTMQLGLIALALVSLLLRFRRARGDERQQLKVLAVAAVLYLGFALFGDLLPETFAVVLGSLTSIGFTVAIALAVLRHGLYEIDRIISRTATYAAVTAVLVGLYVLVAVVPSAVFAFDSDLLVAGATLAAAAAFGPVRRRVQGWVDRRFDRARYDAERVVAGFGGELRDELSLGDLRGSLVGAISRAIHPAHVSVWLPGERVP